MSHGDIGGPQGTELKQFHISERNQIIALTILAEEVVKFLEIYSALYFQTAF